MSKIKKVQGIVLVVLIFVVVPVLLLMLVWKDRCVHTVLNKVVSQTGDLQAVLQETDCGLTMSKATQVLLEVKKDSAWGSVGDIVVIQGVHPVTLEWQEQNELLIAIPEGAVIVKSRDQVGEARISYVPPK